MIWFHKTITLAQLQALCKNTLAEHLGMVWVEIGDDFLIAKMPVDHRTHQPYGLLHGGASVALAETMGSVGAAICVDETQNKVVGLEINANHIRTVSAGFVYGTARPIHRGASTQVWEIKITDEHQKLVCISRITVAVLTIKH